MSNLYGDIPGMNGTNPISPTGESKYNARVDKSEWKKRNVVNPRAAEVYQRELVFGRANKLPSPLIKSGFQDGHVQVFAGFDGALNDNETEFWFAGLACNAPEHQQRNGPLNAQFAINLDGTNTISCRSKNALRKFCRFMWSIPRSPDLPIDGTGAGRQLAELSVYDPQESVIRAHNLHALISNFLLVRAGASGATKLSVHDEIQSQLPVKLWELIRSIMYTGTLAFLAADTDSPQLSLLTAREKLRIAEIFGLTDVVNFNEKNRKGQNERAIKFEQYALDSVFQLMYNPSSRTSSGAAHLTAFQLHAAGTAVQEQREQEVARKQAGQVDALVKLIVSEYDKTAQRVVGVSLTGGFPGFDMDVLLRRL